MAEARVSSRRVRAGDDVVGPFLIGSEIGKGSFAQVYMGKHKVRTLFSAPSHLPIPTSRVSVMNARRNGIAFLWSGFLIAKLDLNTAPFSSDLQAN